MCEKLLPEWKEKRLRNWWLNGRQDIPCISGTILNDDAELPQTGSLEKFWTDVDFIIKRKMAEIDQTTYYGCAVPVHYIDQGSSAMAGVLGCPLEYVDQETIWAHPKASSLDAVFEAKLDKNQDVYARIRELSRRSAEIAKEHHYVAVFALEGMSDLLSAIYPIENFLMDTIMRTGDMKRAIRYLNNLWLEAWADIQQIICRSGNKGGTGWAGIWAPGSTFPLQEDVSYNIGPDQFEDLLLLPLKERIAVMDCPFFHLDGIGMLPHLPLLMNIPELPVIQWVPGAGNWQVDRWYDVITQIKDAGKSIQLYVTAEEVDLLIRKVGPDGLFLTISNATHENMSQLLKKYPQDT